MLAPLLLSVYYTGKTTGCQPKTLAGLGLHAPVGLARGTAIVGRIIPLLELCSTHQVLLCHIGLVDLVAIALASWILLRVDLYDGTTVCGRVIYLAI
jgi:hypothetical protein